MSGTSYAGIFQRKNIVEALSSGAVAVLGTSLMAGRFDSAALLSVGAPAAVGSMVANFVKIDPITGIKDFKDIAIHVAVAGGSAVALMSLAGLDGAGGLNAQTVMLVAVIGGSAVIGNYIADNYLKGLENGK